MYAIVKYDFGSNTWHAELEDDPSVMGGGDTPQEAVDNLRFQANKHDLWPKEG